MNWPEIESAIFECFKLNWNDRSLISYPNAPFENPDKKTFIQIAPVYMLPDVSLGKVKVYRHMGYVWFGVNVKTGSGSGEASDLKQAITEILSIKGIVFYPSKFHQTKETESYKKYMFIIPWSCEEIVDIVTESSINIVTSALNSWPLN